MGPKRRVTRFGGTPRPIPTRFNSFVTIATAALPGPIAEQVATAAYSLPRAKKTQIIERPGLFYSKIGMADIMVRVASLYDKSLAPPDLIYLTDKPAMALDSSEAAKATPDFFSTNLDEFMMVEMDEEPELIEETEKNE